MIEYKILIDLIHSDCRDTRAPCRLFFLSSCLASKKSKTYVRRLVFSRSFFNKLFDCRGIIDHYLLQIEREKKITVTMNHLF